VRQVFVTHSKIDIAWSTNQYRPDAGMAISRNTKGEIFSVGRFLLGRSIDIFNYGWFQESIRNVIQIRKNYKNALSERLLSHYQDYRY
jgi:hypothetical protein